MARASDGSTYMSFSDNFFPGPGHVFRIEIDDQKNNRHLTLHPGFSTSTYSTRTPANGHSRLFSIQQSAEMLTQIQDSYAQRPDRPKSDGQSHITALGTRNQDGMTLFGHKSEFTSTTGEKRIEEIWDSEFGIVVASKITWPTEDKEAITTVSDIHRIEPDPTLFQIPEGYRNPSVTPPGQP